MSKLGKFRKLVTSETHTRPHFATHTESSLMKRRTPMKSKKKSSSSMKDVNESKRPQGNVALRLNGIHKKRSSIVKQSRSMQMTIMILKQQTRDRRTTVFLPGSELTGTTCRFENSFVSLQSDLIKDVSCDLKKCTGSPVKLATLRGEPTKVVDESERHAENSHASQDGTNCTERDNSESILVSSKDRAIVGVMYNKLQLHSSDETESASSRCEVEVLDRRTESGGKPKDCPSEDCPEIETQVHPQGVNAATNRKHRTRKIWTSRRTGAWNEHVDVDRACRTNLQNSKSTKHIDNPQDNWSANDKQVVTGNAITRKRGALQKNLASNQRAWRPAGVTKTWITESATSLQPISQKSSQLAEKSTASSRNKHSSTEHVEALNSESTSTLISTNQTKMLMKENRDPRANRMTKICEHLAEAKQQQRLQSGGTLPKKRWWRTKIGTKASDKRDDANPTLPKTKSRHCQTPPIMPKESSNNSNVEQHRNESILTHSKRPRTLEVIHTLRKFIASVTEDEDAEKNAVNDDFHKKKERSSEIQTSPNRDTPSRNNELRIFTKDVNLDEADRSSRRSISTQTELDLPSYQKIDAERDQDLKEILKLTRTVATQTSPSCNRNVVEIGCNTSNIVYNDAEVSCDPINFSDSKIEIDPATIEDKSTLDGLIRTEPSSVKHIKINFENEDANENRELSLSGCKETLNTAMSLKLENYDSVKILAKTTSDAAREAEKIMHEKACQISLKSCKDSDDKTNTDVDKHPESTKCSNNHDANSTSVNNLFLARSRSSIYDYDTSRSSGEVTEYPENDVQYEDMITSKLKAGDISSSVIAAFELAAERARNLHKAVIIYHENLISKESKKRNEETVVEDYETSEVRDDRHCLGTYEPFIIRENEDKIKSECEAIYHFANSDKDFDGFSTCSSRGSNFDRICEFERFLRSEDDYFGIDREEENAILPENEQAIARSILNERPDLEEAKSLMQLLVHGTEEEYALELLQSERNGSDESFETGGAINKTLALPAAIKKTRLLSRENLLPLICCVVCTVVFWFLPFSFRCDSTK